MKNPCHGNTTCLIDPKTGDEVCQCPFGRYGIHCELISACGSNPCVQGICQNKNETTFQCICKPGFTGNNCDISFDICHTNPCKLGLIIRNRIRN